MLRLNYMNDKHTFFQIDQMVIFKQVSPDYTKVLRLDDEHILEFENHLSVAWNLLAEGKSLFDIKNYFTTNCELEQEEANTSLDQMIQILTSQKLGKIITKTEVP
jgi:hypothetical protein